MATITLVPDLQHPPIKALRKQFGETLVALGAINPQLVVLDADLSCSTQTQLFAKAYPDRFFNQGIAEQDLMNTAAGLAAVGMVPVLSTFAIFATGKAWEPLRNTVCYSNLNVKIMPTHSGISLGEDGASHQSIEDIALTRVIPKLTVLVPADAVQTDAMVRWAIQEHVGPVYVRLVRPDCPVIYDAAAYTYRPGKIDVLRQGTDVTLAATGEMVYHALLAAETLAAQGISAEVLNIGSIKPLDVETLVASAQKTERVVTIESHQVIGGLGGAVCEALSQHHPTPVKCLGTQDRFGQSGTAEALFTEYGLDVPAIVQAVTSWSVV